MVCVESGKLYSPSALAKQHPGIARLPVSVRVVLEPVLRNCDGQRVSDEHVAELANWKPNAVRTQKILFVASRVAPPGSGSVHQVKAA
ncbi:MAG: hypothetical protein EAZ34_10285 [Polaromonas sp.]|nr:MAG: hypothetical protein EAZ34_10285 [Polaromonas sp.]